MLNNNQFVTDTIKFLEDWKAEKEKGGYIPTIQLLIDDLKGDAEDSCHCRKCGEPLICEHAKDEHEPSLCYRCV